MNYYAELERMQHHGREEIAEQIEQHLRCYYCDVKLTEFELEHYGNVCKVCNEHLVEEFRSTI